MTPSRSAARVTVTTVPAAVGAVGGWVIAHRIDPDSLALLGSLLLVPLGLSLIR
ncbi:hypothetical protein [Natronolimnohabitans innermongolicus]|uniref:hypothetical protein n=1 Tax=Natronolimnohabitans innermongolicus TaxID=253107 RepID=UPI00137624C7|nr:hypothetical protein [Natronolimnohabitans innermongolicus]